MVIGRVGRPHGLDGAFVVVDASEDERRWRVGATLLADGQPATVELDDGTLVPLIEDAVRAVDLDARRLVLTPGFLPPPATSRPDR